MSALDRDDAAPSAATLSAAPGSAAAGPAAPGRLHQGLSSFGVLLLTLSGLSPVFSIYGVGADVLQHAGSGAALLFLLGIVAAVIWAAVYAELGSAFPYAGGDYVGVGAILGGWAGAVTLALWAVTAGPSVAFEAEIIATYVSDLLPGVPAAVFTFGSLAAALVIALLAVRIGALITGIFLAIEMVAVLVLIGAGLLSPHWNFGAFAAPPIALDDVGLLGPVSFGALALAGVNAAYATVGGNQALYFGEELGDPHRRMGGVVTVAALTGAVATALPVVAVVIGAGDLERLLHSATPLSAFISAAIGTWAGHALSFGVALAIFNAMIAAIMINARLFFSLGRDALFHRRVNTLLASVHHTSGCPRAATLVVGAFSALCCLFSSHVLLVFITGLLVFAWSLVCLAVLIGRHRGLTGGPGYWRTGLHPIAPLLGLAMAASFTIADVADPDIGRPSILILGGVVAAAALWHRFVLRRRPGGWSPILTK
jgi:amino acid transporter